MKTSEIDGYKERLRALRSELIGEIKRLQETAIDDIKSDTDLSNVPIHNADHDSEGLQAVIGLEKVEGHLLNQVNNAIRRIDEGTFGKCEDCGGEIHPERLEELPYTAWCIECARNHEPA